MRLQRRPEKTDPIIMHRAAERIGSLERVRMEAWRQGRGYVRASYGHHVGLDKKRLLMEDSC
jgi:hypothetical protein